MNEEVSYTDEDWEKNFVNSKKKGAKWSYIQTTIYQRYDFILEKI